MSISAGTRRTLLKEFRIETKGKSKTLSIFHGDILEDTSDIIGISMYSQEDSKGELYKSFKEQSLTNASYTPERIILADGENGWTGVSSSIDLKRHIIYIHSTSEEGDVIQSDNLRSILKMTFASLSSFIYEGNEIRSAALPVLFRKGIKNSDYKNFIHLFIYESAKFLRKNTNVESLNFYIWHSEDAHNWLEVLNENLQLSIDRDVNMQTISSLKQEILLKIKQPYLKRLLPDWFPGKVQFQLTKRESDKYQLASIGDRLVNVIVDALCNLPTMPTELKNLHTFKKILHLKSQRLLIEWLADYMLSIKIYKNYVKDYSPSKMDEYQYLLQLSQVLKVCEQLLQNLEKVENK